MSVDKHKYDYTIYPDNNFEVFKETCRKIEISYPDYKKNEILIDVDGSYLQIYEKDKKEIVVYEDYDVGAIYVKSDIDLSGTIKDYWADRK